MYMKNFQILIEKIQTKNTKKKNKFMSLMGMENGRSFLKITGN